MIRRTMIGDLSRLTGRQAKIQGWLQALRDQKKMQFLVIRDTTGLVQVALEKQANPSLAERLSRLPVESVVTVVGEVVANPVVKLGGLEIVLKELVVESEAETQLPLDPVAADSRAGMDTRMDWRYLDLRRSTNLLMMKVQALIETAMREYWHENQFIEIHTPKLMGAPSESGAELFEMNYFDTKAYLAQSPQFYKQMAMAAGLERVFEIAPVFRADPSFTSRHMTEFTSVDVELSFIDSHEDVMAFLEKWLAHVYSRVIETCHDEIQEAFNINLRPLTVPFPRISMAEAQHILGDCGYKLPPEKQGDIDPGGEQLLGQWVKDKYAHDYFFLTDWPATVRPFYHMRYEQAPDTTLSFDLIGHGLELSTGAQREHRVEVLKRQALEKGLRLQPIEFYLNFFRYGCPPHGGFAVGLSRLVMVMLGLQNIRETVYLFRGPTRLFP